MFFFFSKVLLFLLSPFSWLGGLLLAGLLVKKQILKKRLFLFAIILFFTFGNVWIIRMLYAAWELPYRDLDKHYSVAIVLTGFGAYDLDSHQFNFSDGADRFTSAVELYHTGQVDKVLITGGSGSLTGGEEKTSDSLKLLMIRMGVPDSVIISEPNSRNTYENAAFTRQTLMQEDSLQGSYVLITSAWHMRRSQACFRKAGIVFDIYPVDSRSSRYYFNFDDLFPSPGAIDDWDVLIKEWVGYLVYKLKGYA